MEALFNSYKIKYEKMNELINKEHLSLKGNIDVYINLENVLNRLTSRVYTEPLLTQVNDDNIYRFISNVCNLAAHYKAYFTKRGMEARVFLYMQYPFDCSNIRNRSILPEYREYYDYKFTRNAGISAVSKMINDSISFIKIILEYVQGVYFIESGRIENSVIPYVINTSNDKNENTKFIVSDKLYDFQYVNYGFNVLIPKKEKSLLMTFGNAIDIIKKMNKVNNSVDIRPELIPFIVSIVGSEHRNIYNVKGLGIKRVFSLLESAVKSKVIASNTNNPYLLIENLVQHKYRSQVFNNFYCVDIDYQYKMLNIQDIQHITKQLVDKFDNASLREINDKHFKDYPLMVMELTSIGKKKKLIF